MGAQYWWLWFSITYSMSFQNHDESDVCYFVHHSGSDGPGSEILLTGLDEIDSNPEPHVEAVNST